MGMTAFPPEQDLRPGELRPGEARRGLAGTIMVYKLSFAMISSCMLRCSHDVGLLEWGRM